MRSAVDLCVGPTGLPTSAPLREPGTMPTSTADAKDMLRVFFALWPDAAALRSLVQLARQLAIERVGRATREDSLHVTVAFIGAVDRGRLTDLHAAGLRAAVATAPFGLALDRLGGTGRGGIGWLAPSVLPAALPALHAALSDALVQGSFPVERRPFRPHVTLARHCVQPVDRRGVAPVSWPVDRLALVASTPAPGGSRYETIAAWPLSAPANQSACTV